MTPNFEAMNRKELRQYILEHRDDEQAFYAYMDRLNQESDKPVFPAPKSIEDLSNFAQLLKQYSDRPQK